MKRRLVLFSGLGLLLFGGLAAQVPNLDLALKIVQERKANDALLKQYTWTCRTELVDNGKVQDIRIEQVQYGPGGTLQRDLLNDDNFNHPKGLLFRRLIEQGQQQQLEKYLKGLRELLDKYTLPGPGKVLDFMASAKVEFTQAPDGTALLKMSGSGVVVPGDTLSLWADASTHKMRKLQITTTYEGGAATVNASFKTLGSGLTFMSLAEVEIPDKHLSLQAHNFDYEPND